MKLKSSKWRILRPCLYQKEKCPYPLVLTAPYESVDGQQLGDRSEIDWSRNYCKKITCNSEQGCRMWGVQRWGFRYLCLNLRHKTSMRYGVKDVVSVF